MDVASVDPLVVIEHTQLVAYSDTGERLWELEGFNGTEWLVPHGVVDGVLFAEWDQNITTPPSAFAGYDLSSGEELWRTHVPNETQLLGVDLDRGTTLLGLYRPVQGDMRMVLRWLDVTDGVERAAETVPFNFAGHGPIVAEATFDADHFYLSNGALEPEYVLRAFDRDSSPNTNLINE